MSPSANLWHFDVFILVFFFFTTVESESKEKCFKKKTHDE